MDKLLILLQLKHAGWGKNHQKRAEMHISGTRLSLFARDKTVNYEQQNGAIP
jgi:hypothetical protein